MSLSERFKLALSTLGRGSQADLARHCGVKPPSVSDWVSGRTKVIDGPHLVKAAKFLGVRVEWLAEGLGPMRDGSSAHAASSVATVHQLTRWPFKRIGHDQWDALPMTLRLQIESYAEGVIDVYKAQHGKQNRAAAASRKR